ncbi:hypothetical protein DBV15_01305 [Temnothorax longispinosus]|uniref:Uncharacterized protein n=1 Tax=Temnothorax longispinosus TaxID=300112 RepID=A0A4S2KK29_9HYME|nr:hypothetical protein DBV15_01305 [Temnothorax longispinosus]
MDPIWILEIKTSDSVRRNCSHLEMQSKERDKYQRFPFANTKMIELIYYLDAGNLYYNTNKHSLIK